MEHDTSIGPCWCDPTVVVVLPHGRTKHLPCEKDGGLWEPATPRCMGVVGTLIPAENRAATARRPCSRCFGVSVPTEEVPCDCRHPCGWVHRRFSASSGG